MNNDLLQFTESGGCSAKIPPGKLDEILSAFPLPKDKNLLVDISTHDDAAVYRISDDLALVLTTDFFPPVCSDPYEFGQIAAANSISDVYAMGGKPALALNIMMFPSLKLPLSAYAEIMRGASDKAAEAGVMIIGGHTVEDEVPKFGLSVTGFVNPADLVTNAGARPGEVLVLTKAVGTGIVMAGHRAGLASDAELDEAKLSMKLLNMNGARLMSGYGVKGATDITGFGLAGHALKMARASGVTFNIRMKDIPLFSSVYRLADDGCLPGACFTNLSYCEKDIAFHGEDYNLKMIAFDAQTSGGLLLSVPGDKAEDLIAELHQSGELISCIIGEAEELKGKFINLYC